ncbi:MAG: response regulator [Chthoniobacterales bacterium]
MTPTHRLVCVVDDDLSMGKAVGRLLESEDYAVEIFAGAREFLARVPHTGPSCVILDLNMPGLNGLELQEMLAQTGRVEQIIFITGGATVPSCVQAMKAGAVDYLQKPFRDEDLLIAVERALKRSSEQWLRRLERKEARERLATLTPREFDVLKGVIAGMLNKQIAAQFGTTEGTVKVHRGRVMEKMGATSVAELVIVAQRAGIAPTARDATKV